MKKAVFEKYRAFTQKHKDAIPQIEFINVKKQDSFQYVGAQIADKKLYSVVNSAKSMLTYDISSTESTFLGDFGTNDFKWSGGCVIDNYVVFFPRTKNSLLWYNTATGEFKEKECPFNYEKEHHYGGICTESKIIYQPPRDTNHILKWDLNSDSCAKIEINNAEPGRYCGSIIHPNGYAYFLPEYSYTVVKMNLSTEETEYIGSPYNVQSFNPAIAPNGNIYGFGANDGIVKIDTENDSVSVLYGDCRFGSYGTKVGINGKLYSLPGYTGDIWEFDPDTETVKKICEIPPLEGVHYAGGAVDTDGDIYALPVHEDNILKITFNEDKETIPSDVYNCFFRDFY